MTTFQGQVFLWLRRHGEAHGFYGAENYEFNGVQHIGAWDATREISLAIVCADDWNDATGKAWLQRAETLADELSAVQTWDEYWGTFEQYQHLPVVVMNWDTASKTAFRLLKLWDGVVWAFDGIGMIGIDR